MTRRASAHRRRPEHGAEVYAQYRDAGAVEAVNPHLHNVPMQIAAERGLPALGVSGSGSSSVLARSLLTAVPSAGGNRVLPATGTRGLAAMLAAGMFEYNFGDSEFLMLFLVLVTLPFAAMRSEPSTVRT